MIKKENQTKNEYYTSPKIEKITVNIGVGEAGERLEKAQSVLKDITGHKPLQTLSKITSKDWSLRKRMPIGCKVALRKKDAEKFLKEKTLLSSDSIPIILPRYLVQDIDTLEDWKTAEI